MSPILGIWASAQQGAFAGSFDSIATVTVGSGGSATVEFTSIPGTYKHLQIRGFAASGSAANARITFNNDSANNYTYHYLEGNGATVAAGGQGTAAYIVGPVTTNTSSAYSGIIIDILDYADTNKFKTIRTLSGVDLNGSSTWLDLMSGSWRSTNAITSIKFTLSGTTYSQYSHFALYGVKG